MVWLIRMEFEKAFKSIWFLLPLAIGLICSVCSGVQRGLVCARSLSLSESSSLTKWFPPYTASIYNQWLPLDINTAFSDLFFFLAPLLYVTVYAWSYAQESKCGYLAHMLTRTYRLKYYFIKYLAVFLTGGLVIVIPMLINLVVLACFIPAYTPEVFDLVFTYMGMQSAFAEQFYTAPGLYVVLRLILNFLLCGLWAACTLAISTILRNRITIMVVPFLLLLVAKQLSDNFFAAMNLSGYMGFGFKMAFTLFDQLIANGHPYNASLPMTLVCMFIMLVFSVTVPLLAKRRDIL